MTLIQLDWIYHQHDVICNQKYAKIYPYSLHLKSVIAQYDKFKHLLKQGDERYNSLIACAGHDLIEDARITYNDCVEKFGVQIADIIYCCTEEKGRNRKERHSDKYYEELSKNELAVFVKLCDVIANVTFSLLENSSMYEKYKKEFPNFLEKLYTRRFDDMFKYLEKLLNL